MNGNDPKKTYNAGLLKEIEISTSKDGKVKGVKTPIFKPMKTLTPISNNSTPIKNKFASQIGRLAGEQIQSVADLAAAKEASKRVSAVSSPKIENNVEKGAPAVKKAWNMYKSTMVAGQNIKKDGTVVESYQDGPRSGDKIVGSKLQYGPEGNVMDMDYNVRLKSSGIDKTGKQYRTYTTD